MSRQKDKKRVVLTGITNKTNERLMGFCVCFTSKDYAQYYKEMFGIILGSDKFDVEYREGYYDKKQVKKE